LGPTPRHRFSEALVALLAVAAVPVAIADAASKPPVKVTHLSDDFFNRGKITIKKGTVVNWKWNTKHRHTVTEYNGNWGTKSETRTGNFRHRFKKKGTWTVYCLVHPVEMRQKIVVK
jgi:plastocyanin